MLSFHGTFFVLAREGGCKFWITLYIVLHDYIVIIFGPTNSLQEIVF